MCNKVAVQEPEVDAAEAKKQRKAAKRAAAEAEAAAAAQVEVDAAEAKKARKAAKKAAAEAEASTAEQPEVDAAEAKKARKAAKKAAAEAAAAAAEQPEVDPAEEKKARKAAKKAAAEAEAATAEEPEIDAAAAKKARKAAKRAAAEALTATKDVEDEEEEVKTPEPKKSKTELDDEQAPKEAKGKGKGNKEFEIFVGGLPFSATEETVKKDFAECGKIVAFRLPLNDEGNARGIAFIEYADKESCDKALKFHDTEYGGRWLSVRMSGDTSGKDGKGKGKDGKGKDKGKGKAKGKDGGKDGGKGNKEFELFIGGLPWSTTEDVLRKDFAECGEIVNLRMPLNDEGNAKGIAFIEYSDKESVEKALKFNETDYGGRTLSVRMSGDPAPPKGDGKGKGKDGKGKGNKEFEVFVGGLPFSSTEEALKEKFAECGEIANLRMPLNDEGKPRGIAFIEFKDKDACEKALKFNESEMDGRSLSVKMSGDGGGKDGKGKGKDGKSKGKGKKGKGKATSESKAKSSGCIVEGAGEKKTFDDSDDE